MTQRLKVRQITVAVTSDMLGEIESYIQAHEDMDWQDVVNEALEHWYGLMPRKAMVRQRLELKSPDDFEEQSTLKLHRAAHNCHLGRTYRPRSEV